MGNYVVKVLTCLLLLLSTCQGENESWNVLKHLGYFDVGVSGLLVGATDKLVTYIGYSITTSPPLPNHLNS